MKIIFLNLSDPGPLGEKSARSLREKYGQDNVILVNLMNEALAWRNRGFNGINHASRIDLSQYDQIIVGSHSSSMKDNRYQKDIDYCYCETEPNQFERLFSYEELAIFLKNYWVICDLPRNKPLNLVLSICYGGRSDHYEIDHVSNSQAIDFKRTFAYQFLSALYSTLPKLEMAANPQVILRAYTGETSFNSNTGELVVETESQIRLLKDIDKIDEGVEALLAKLDQAKINALPDALLWEEYDKLIAQKAGLLSKRLDLRAHYGELICRANADNIIENVVDIQIDTSGLRQSSVSSAPPTAIQQDAQPRHCFPKLSCFPF